MGIFDLVADALARNDYGLQIRKGDVCFERATLASDQTERALHVGRAREHYNAALRIDYERPEAFIHRARLLQRFADRLEDYTAALADLERAGERLGEDRRQIEDRIGRLRLRIRLERRLLAGRRCPWIPPAGRKPGG